MDSEISGLSSDPPKQNASLAQFDTAKNVYVPSQAEIKKFFESLNASNTHPAILSLIPPYNIKYFPKADNIELPKPLTGLYDSELCKLDFEDLLEKSNRVFEAMNISSEQTKAIEEATRNQSKSSLWFDMRAWRITASFIKLVTQTLHYHQLASSRMFAMAQNFHPRELPGGTHMRNML